jgi:protein arginine kinase
MNDLNDEEKLALVEKHIISEDLTKGRIHRYAVIRNDESVSVMINEEDHVRIQAMEAGLNLEAAQKNAQDVAFFLEKNLPVAYHEKFGFLTSCPTNTGTGLRASVIMHLPGLVLTQKISSVVEKVQKMGYSVRGYYGENSSSIGNMFQISNQITLGLAEDELISDLKKLIYQIMEQERAIRKDIYTKNPLYIEDMVFRSLGLLKYARVLTSDESLRMISDVRLGAALGIIKDVEDTSINRLMTLVGPASVQKEAGRVMEPKERDKTRAFVIRKELKDGDSK